MIEYRDVKIFNHRKMFFAEVHHFAFYDIRPWYIFSVDYDNKKINISPNIHSNTVRTDMTCLELIMIMIQSLVQSQTELQDHFNIEGSFPEEESFESRVKPTGSVLMIEGETPDLQANNIYSIYFSSSII